MINGDKINITAVNTLFHPDKGGATVVCKNRFNISFFNGRIDDRHDYLHSVHYQINRIQGLAVNIYNLFPPNISSWIDGTLESNYYNPSINNVFEEFIAEQQPSIVHFHSMQWLGAQLILIAKEFGAKTILTMHDWWWICPRQFLVKQDGSLCNYMDMHESCTCIDPESFLKRSEFLQKCLRYVDTIIVPSHTLKKSLLYSGSIKQPIVVIPGEY